MAAEDTTAGFWEGLGTKLFESALSVGTTLARQEIIGDAATPTVTGGTVANVQRTAASPGFSLGGTTGLALLAVGAVVLIVLLK